MWNQITKDENLKAGAAKSEVDESERASKNESIFFGGMVRSDEKHVYSRKADSGHL